MRNQDEFDEPNATKALGSIVNALDLRAKFEARKPVIASGVVIALVAVLGGVVWYSYPKESAQREVMNTPIVRADAGDYRTTPSEPGGMAVPYRESTVFNTMRAGEGEQTAKVENLLPQAEQPVSRDELFAGLKVETPAAPATETAPGVTTETTTTTAPVETPVAAADVPAATTTTTTTTAAAVTETPAFTTAAVAEAKPVEPAKPETVAAAVDTKAVEAAKTEPAAGVQKVDDAPKASSGGFYVQLGSVKARDGADGEWKKLQKSFSSLSSLSMRVQEANLGDKGTFFRIQGGPVTEAQAKSICDGIKAQKPGGCLVVRQ